MQDAILCLCTRSFTAYPPAYPPSGVGARGPINVCLIGKFYAQKVLQCEDVKTDKLGGCTVNWEKYGGLAKSWEAAKTAAGWQ